MAEVRENNLYQNGKIFQVGEDMLLLRNILDVEGDLTDVYHTVSSEDELDQLAHIHYSKYVADASKYWWLIADANNIFNPWNISNLVGTQLLIPNIQRFKLSQ